METRAKSASTSARSSRVINIRENYIGHMKSFSKVDPDKPWVPEEFTITHFLPSYQKLSRRRRMELNHLYALRFCEGTIFLESWFEMSLRHHRSRELFTNEQTDKIIADEQEHTRWFKDLLIASRPDLYTETKNYWLLPKALPLLTNWIGRVAFFDIFALFFGLYFEERFLTLNRLIQKNPGIDEYHRATHSAHAIDEALHVSDDTSALKVALSRASSLKKKFNSWAIQKTLDTIFNNISFGARDWQRLENLTQDEKQILEDMKSELKQFIRTPGYQELIFSKEWNPIVHRFVRSESRLSIRCAP